MTIQQLLDPQSKLSTYNQQNRYLGLPEVKLQHLYRSLDLLAESKEVLEEELFFKNRHLFNMQVDAVFYDVTTFSFERVKKDILKAYHTLWKIEESFRIMKSTLEVRPIFHWTEPRIKGHFVICFLAFLLERTLEFQLKKAHREVSPQQIRETLNSMNFAEVKIKQNKFNNLGNKILRLSHIKPPSNVTPASELSW